MTTFNRDGVSQLQITLTSNEPLGVLDSGFLEDYFGVDNQVTLHNLDTGVRTPVLMGETGPEALPHEVFTGFAPLIGLPNGNYSIEGQVRDPWSNYTVLTDALTGRPGARIIPMTFQIVSSSALVIDVRVPIGQEILVVGGTDSLRVPLPQIALKVG